LKASWAKKTAGTGKYSDKKAKSDGNAFAQVLDCFSSKLEKTLKKVASRKKKRRHDSDSDSDSE
jgi:ribosome-associated translation inhibitor RaiA